MRCGESIIEVLNSDSFSIYSHHNYDQVVVLSDINTAKHCLPRIANLGLGQTANIQTIVIEEGEAFKTLNQAESIWQQLIEYNIGKKALLINVGGGVITDIGGFVASLYKRGIKYWHVPTTLLGQVDAAIGGKNGIDFLDFKNQIGSITFPEKILIWPPFLETLNKRELISGFAEVIKYALISDKSLWDLLQEIRELNEINWFIIIERCASIKSEIVNKDPFEKDVRKALNFGHTIGHAIESYFLKKGHAITHGEAIAYGMECELYLSGLKLNLDSERINKAVTFIRCFFPKIEISSTIRKSLIELMYKDKKNIGNKINFTLIPELGQFQVNHEIDEQYILQCMDLYSRMNYDSIKS